MNTLSIDSRFQPITYYISFAYIFAFQIHEQLGNCFNVGMVLNINLLFFII